MPSTIDFTPDTTPAIDFTPDAPKQAPLPPGAPIPGLITPPRGISTTQGGPRVPVAPGRVFFNDLTGQARDAISNQSIIPEQALDTARSWAGNLSPQKLADAMDALGGAPVEFEPGGLEEMLARPSRQPSGAESIAAGAIQGVNTATVGMAEFLTTPLGVATLGTGAMPAAARRVVAGAFATHMASAMPEQYRQLEAAVGTGNPEVISKTAAELGINAALVGATAAHALKPGLAGESALVRDAFTEKLRETYTPEDLRALKQRVDTGQASPAETVVFQTINADLAKSAGGRMYKQGEVMRESTSPRFDLNMLNKWLGIPAEMRGGKFYWTGADLEAPAGPRLKTELKGLEEPQPDAAAVPSPPAPEPPPAAPAAPVPETGTPEVARALENLRGSIRKPSVEALAAKQAAERAKAAEVVAKATEQLPDDIRAQVQAKAAETLQTPAAPASASAIVPAAPLEPAATTPPVSVTPDLAKEIEAALKGNQLTPAPGVPQAQQNSPVVPSAIEPKAPAENLEKARALLREEGKIGIALLQRDKRSLMPFEEAKRTIDAMEQSGEIIRSKSGTFIASRKPKTPTTIEQPKAPPAAKPDYTPETPVARAPESAKVEAAGANVEAVDFTPDPAPPGAVITARRTTTKYGLKGEDVPRSAAGERGARLFSQMKENRPPDLLDWFQDNFGGGITLESVRNLDPNFQATGPLRKLIRPGIGADIDQVHQAAVADRQLPDWSQADDLIASLLDVPSQRARYREKYFAESRELNRQGNASNAFATDAADARKDSVPVVAEDLQPGDAFQLKGHPLKVTDVQRDESGAVQSVTLDDGNKYQTQTVPASEVMQADAGTLALAKGRPMEQVLPRESTPTQPTARQAGDEQALDAARGQLGSAGPALRIVSPRNAGNELFHASEPSGLRSRRGVALDQVRHELERVFRVRIVFVSNPDGSPTAFRGAHPAGTRSLFIDANNDRPLEVVIGHELGETMRTQHPALHRAMMDALRPLMQNVDAYRARLEAASAQAAGEGVAAPRVDTAHVEAEIAHDFIGDNLGNPEFWDRLAEMNPNVFRRVARLVQQWLRRLEAALKRLTGYGSEEFINDVATAREVVADALDRFAELSKRGPSKADGGGGTGKMEHSLRDPDLTANVSSDVRKPWQMTQEEFRVKRYFVDRDGNKLNRSPTVNDNIVSDPREEFSIGETRWFYRAGTLPESGFSRDYKDNRTLKGVSVYPLPRASSLAGMKSADWYVGKGTVVGIGPDGEPLIKPSGRWVRFSKEGTTDREADAHRWWIRKAISEGKPVPAEVLKDYPDITPKAADSFREASDMAFSLRDPRNVELNRLQKKTGRTPTENARITELQAALGQEDLFATDTKPAADIEAERQAASDKAELERRRTARLTAGDLETQRGLFSQPGQEMLFSLRNSKSPAEQLGPRNNPVPKFIANPESYDFKPGEAVSFEVFHGSKAKLIRKPRTTGDSDNSQAAGLYVTIDRKIAENYKPEDLRAWKPLRVEDITFEQTQPGEWLVFARGQRAGITRNHNRATDAKWLAGIAEEKVAIQNHFAENKGLKPKPQKQGKIYNWILTLQNPVVGDAADWIKARGLDYENMSPFDVREEMIRAGHDGQIDVKSGDKQAVVFYPESLQAKTTKVSSGGQFGLSSETQRLAPSQSTDDFNPRPELPPGDAPVAGSDDKMQVDAKPVKSTDPEQEMLFSLRDPDVAVELNRIEREKKAALEAQDIDRARALNDEADALIGGKTKPPTHSAMDYYDAVIGHRLRKDPVPPELLERATEAVGIEARQALTDMRALREAGQPVPAELSDRFQGASAALDELWQEYETPPANVRLGKNDRAAKFKYSTPPAEEKLTASGAREALDKLKLLRDRIKAFWKGNDIRGQMSYTKDAAENAAKLFGHRAARLVLHEMNRAFGDAPGAVNARHELREYALTFVIEANGDPVMLQEFRERIRGTPAARETLWGRRAMQAIDYAEKHREVLEGIAQTYRDVTDIEREAEERAGLKLGRWRQGYVFHLQDADIETLIATGVGEGQPGTPFRHARSHPNYAASIAAGVKPKTLNAIDLLQRRLAMGQTWLNEIAWIDAMKDWRDPSTDLPVTTTELIVKARPDGTIDVTAPPGYHLLRVGPVEFGLLNAYKGAFDDLTKPSWVRGEPIRHAVQKGVALSKSIVLLGDSFHLGRLMFWRMIIGGLPRYGKGLSLLDNTPEDLKVMAERGEIPADWVEGLTENAALADLATRTGFNVGSVSDNMHQELVQSLPGLKQTFGRFNKFLFGAFQRGAMMESWLIEFNRLKRQMFGAEAELTEADQLKLARIVSKDLNTRFGNLGRQGIFRSQTGGDIARLLFLAPQWNEALIRAELGAVKQGLMAIPNAVRGRPMGEQWETPLRRRLVAGTMLRAVGMMILAQFVGNQFLNWAFRNKPTWENEEEGFGPKISGYIPDVVGNGPGFLLNPLALAAEITHLAENKMERSGTSTEAVTQMLESRYSGPTRALSTIVTRKDGIGRSLRGSEVLPTAAKALIPLPIASGSMYAAGKQLATGENNEQFPGQFQKQALASFGIKTDQAPSEEQRISALAREFNREKGIEPSAEFFAGDFSDYTKAVRMGNATEARRALEILLTKKTPRQVYDHYRRWEAAPFTGQKDREMEFVRQLDAEQKRVLKVARESRQRVAREAIRMLPRQGLP